MFMKSFMLHLSNILYSMHFMYCVQYMSMELNIGMVLTIAFPDGFLATILHEEAALQSLQYGYWHIK